MPVEVPSGEQGGGEGREDQLAFEPEQVEHPAPLLAVEATHGRPALVGHQPLLGLGRLGRIGAPAGGQVDRTVEHGLQRLHAVAAQPVALGGIDEVVEEVGQLHHVAVRVEHDASSCVGHRVPPRLRR